VLKNYLLTAFKVFLRRKFFTFASLFGICFTLVVLMVGAAVLDHLLAPSAPETRMDRTLVLSLMRMTGDRYTSDSSPGYRFLDQNVRDLPRVERMTIYSEKRLETLYRDGERLELYLRRTDGDYWRVLEFDFLEGSPYSEEDNAAGRRVAVISARTRDRLFDGEPALGRTNAVERQDFEVVGVVPDVSFLRTSFSDVWVPITTSRSQTYREQFMGGFNALLLAERASDLPLIQDELAARLPDIELPDPERFDTLQAPANTHFQEVAAELLSAHDGEAPTMQLRAIIVLGALLFMLLPSLNLINLNLSRILERSSEIGVRRAFGARSRSLLVQFLVENVLLTLVGGLIGLAVAAWVLAWINQAGWLPYVDFHLNWRVFGWGMLLALVFGVLSGVYPAWKMSRLHPAQALSARSKL
jgi:putative ABC transport system permease protein